MRKRILVVEDNTELLEFLRMALEQAGFSVLGAVDGVQALRKARAFKPHLILLDMVLPELDGFAVCEVLRRDSLLGATPIIALSGLTTEFSRFAGLESGANEFVTKPVSTSHLVSRIRHWLGPPAGAPSPPAAAPSQSDVCAPGTGNRGEPRSARAHAA